MELGTEARQVIANPKKIAFIVPYPAGEAPSQRFRFEQYLPRLKAAGFLVHQFPFYGLATWRMMYNDSGWVQKSWGVFIAILKRKLLVFRLGSFDYVFIHREAMPVGPPVLEWMIAKVLHKKIIYDFDDAIWLTDEKERLSNKLRCFWKVKYICKWSYRVSCGNAYLANYASQWNDQVVINPTTIDMDYHVPDSNLQLGVPSGLPTIGWTGSHSTIKYLDGLLPVLKKYQHRFKLLVICDQDPAYDLAHYEFVKWTTEAEIPTLNRMDIGIMPLPNDRWTEGKCGFKALQYMAMAKPVICSPVGVNTSIVNHGQNGLLADTDTEWQEAFELLLNNHQIGIRLGLAGQKKVIDEYSVRSNSSLFVGLFD